MDRREFIAHSGVVLGVALVGLPSFADVLEPSMTSHSGEFHPRLQGYKRLGCARGLNDPAIALRLPVDFPPYLA